MKVYKYYCKECESEEMLNYDDYIYPDLCPKCNKQILLYTDIDGVGGKYRVLISKKASDLDEGDLYFDRWYNKSYMVKGVISTTKKSKPAVSIRLEGFGSKTILEDDIVYCVNGIWDGQEK